MSGRRGSLPAAVGIVALVILAAAAGLLIDGGSRSQERSTQPAIQPTRANAVAAAVEALYALTLPAFTDRQAFEAAVTRLAAPGMATSVRDAFGAVDPDVLDGFEHQGMLRGAPLGYRIDRYTRGAASIAIWSVAIAAAPGTPPQSQWRTLIVDLAWTASGWRVSHGAGIDGPAPSMTASVLVAEAQDFRSFRHVP